MIPSGLGRLLLGNTARVSRTGDFDGRWLICIFSFFLAIPGSSAVSAATLRASHLKDGRVVILITGELIEGDTEAFKSAVKTANDAGKLVSSIRLNSPGGSLLEGVKLADAVRFGKIVTNVGQGATCASACFLVFAAALARRPSSACALSRPRTRWQPAACAWPAQAPVQAAQTGDGDLEGCGLPSLQGHVDLIWRET